MEKAREVRAFSLSEERLSSLALRLLEVVGEHLVHGLLADHDPVLDGGAVVDAAPDAGVADVVLRGP